MTKVTRRQYEAFKRAFSRWQRKLGLTEWKVRFEFRPLDGEYAAIVYDCDGMIAKATLTSELSEDEDIRAFKPSEHGRHEALHLLCAPLYQAGGARWGNRDAYYQEWEKLVRRLEKVVR